MQGVRAASCAGVRSSELQRACKPTRSLAPADCVVACLLSLQAGKAATGALFEAQLSLGRPYTEAEAAAAVQQAVEQALAG